MPVREAAGGGYQEAFTYRRARSMAITAAIGILLVVETGGFHALLLALGHPVAAWTLTTLSAAALVWLVSDYRAMGSAAIRVGAGGIDVKVGRRIAAVVPRTAVASVIAPGWRDLQAPGSGYLNGTKPATPNVLLTFHDPVAVTLMGTVRRPVRRLGLHLDEPERFIAHFEEDE